MGTKLRAGGPAYCLMSDDRVAITHIWEGPQEVHAVFGDGSRGYHSIDNFTPAPFLPGDVVEHSPGTFSEPDTHGRGIVTGRMSGDRVFVQWQGREDEPQGRFSNVFEGHLTLILPAQEAR